MNNVSLSYTEEILTIVFKKPNESFSDYLLLGLNFTEVSKTEYTKIYSNAEELETEINYIYEELSSNYKKIIRPSYDPFLKSLIQKKKTEKLKLKESIELGEYIKTAPLKDLKLKLKLPKNFLRHPKNFQIRSISHIVNVPNSANFSVPGSGKTTISLAGFSILKDANIVDHLLVVCPLSAFLPWEEEFKSCFGNFPRSIRIVGNNITRKNLYKNTEKADLILITYQMLKFEEKNIEMILKKHKFFLILDESHHVKNFKGGIYASVVKRLAKYAERRLILTGTPVPNNLEDLWSQFTFLWPDGDLLGTKYAYKERIKSDPIGIKREINPLFIRITKDQLKIPKPKIKRVHIELDDAHYEFYHQLARTVLLRANKISSEEDKTTFYKISVQWLLQAIDDPAQLMSNRKVKLTLGKDQDLLKAFEYYVKTSSPKKIEYVDNSVSNIIATGRKVILWTYFIDNINRLSTRDLRKFKPLPLWGGIPKDFSEDPNDNREKYIQLFKDVKSKRPLLIANPAACAESISLHTVCKDALYLDRTFNCAQYLQSVDRIHRIGIVSSPEIKLCIADKTLDEVVDRRLEEKMRLMLKLLDDPFRPINLETTIDDSFGEINAQMENENKKDLELFKEELEMA